MAIHAVTEVSLSPGFTPYRQAKYGFRQRKMNSSAFLRGALEDRALRHAVGLDHGERRRGVVVDVPRVGARTEAALRVLHVLQVAEALRDRLRVRVPPAVRVPRTEEGAEREARDADVVRGDCPAPSARSASTTSLPSHQRPKPAASQPPFGDWCAASHCSARSTACARSPDRHPGRKGAATSRGRPGTCRRTASRRPVEGCIAQPLRAEGLLVRKVAVRLDVVLDLLVLDDGLRHDLRRVVNLRGLLLLELLLHHLGGDRHGKCLTRRLRLLPLDAEAVEVCETALRPRHGLGGRQGADDLAVHLEHGSGQPARGASRRGRAAPPGRPARSPGS